MKKNSIALIYIDDTKIIGTVSERHENMAFVRVATVAEEYSGIMGGELADKEDFTLVFTRVAAELVRTVGKTSMPPILHVVVPNELCHVQTRENSLQFRRSTKINKNHLRDVIAGLSFTENDSEIISKDALYYTVDGADEALFDVRGMKTRHIGVVGNAVSIPREFRACIPIKNVRFVSMANCELFMLPVTERDGGATVLHSDFFSTSVSHVLGDGITYLSHFDMGPGYIVNELAESFGLDYETAMRLLTLTTPTIETGAEDTYKVNGFSLPSSIVNKFIMKRINEMADRLQNVDMTRIVYIAGGNLNDIYGVRNVLSNAIDRRIHVAADNLTKTSKYPDATINACLRSIVIRFGT
jgi:cell division ATPase FtsA